MARTTTVTVLFCDLVGSTALQSRIGDDAADEVRREFFGALRAAVEDNGGSVVKTMGDGAMAAFAESAVGALRCAVTLTEVAGGIGGGLTVRVGVSHGEVTAEDGDLFGTPVVEAARLESAAAPGTVLAAQVVRMIVGSRGGFAFDEVPPLNLKGLAGPVSAVQVRTASAADVATTSATSATPATSATSDGPSRSWLGGLVPIPLTNLRWPRRRVIVGSVVAIVVVAVGVTYLSVSISFHNAPATAASRTLPPLNYTPRFESETCPALVGGPNVGLGITCGVLVVPEDRARPTGPQVHLLVVRAAAQTSHPAADPVIDLGQLLDGTGEGPSSPTRLYAEHIDLYPRGTTGSTPALDCPEVASAEESVLQFAPSDPRVESTIANALSVCRARLAKAGVDPNDFGADAAAADVRDLMTVLHIKQANLVAFTESGIVAFDLMRRYPSLVRTATIEDAIPPGFDASSEQPANLSAALDRYAALCDANASCHTAYPDIRSQAVTTFDKLQAAPVTVPVSPGPGLPPIPVLFNGDRAAQALRDGFLRVEDLPVIAAEVYNPDINLLAAAALEECCTGFNGDVAWGAKFSYLCKDFVPYDNAGRIAADLRALPQFAGVGTINAGLCTAWNVQPDDPNDANSIVSNIPTFLFSGALDPNRPPGWTSDIAQGLSHVVELEFPTMTDGSDVRAPVCLSNLRVAFLKNPTGHFNTAKCEAQSPTFTFAGA